MEEKSKTEQEELFAWAKRLCAYGGENESFLHGFWRKMLDNPGIYEEFAYYYTHRQFLCKTKIAETTVVDILVWQMDHFKARLDRNSEMRTNKDKMLLYAFFTFLNMAENPAPVLARMREETGTDYPDKF